MPCRIDDPGIAVYFTLRKRPLVMALANEEARRELGT
jgi:hypothetical protein